MSLCSEKITFSDFVLQDKAIRAAAGDCTADEFIAIHKIIQTLDTSGIIVVRGGKNAE